jgi:hypothetical protein
MRVVGYSQLVQRLLSPEILYGPSSWRSTDYQSHSIRARGAITHRIIHLGPPRDLIVASSAANKQWRDSFATYFSLPQVVQLLRECNEAYFPVIEGMRCEARRKYRALNPHQMYSRGTLAACSWSNMSRQSDITTWPILRSRAISNLPPFSSSRDSSSTRSRSRPTSPLRAGRTSGSVSRSRPPHRDVMAAMRSMLLDSSEESLGFNQRRRSRARGRTARTRSQEGGRVRGSSPPSVLGRCPSNDLSLISFAESPRTPCEPRLFLSDKGIIGLAPPETKLGDIICQFSATDVTALLREEPYLDL